MATVMAAMPIDRGQWERVALDAERRQQVTQGLARRLLVAATRTAAYAHEVPIELAGTFEVVRPEQEDGITVPADGDWLVARVPFTTRPMTMREATALDRAMSAYRN